MPAAVKVLARGIDYSGYRPDPHDVAKNGGAFIIRYSAGAANDDPGTQWKLCGAGEIAAAVAAGLDFIANSESTETRPTEGAAAGAADGTADLAFWKSRGLAKGATIYVSWDAPEPAAQFPAVAAYLAAYGKALGGYYYVGLYSGDPAIAEMLTRGVIRQGWRSMSDSWSGNGDFYMPGAAWADVAKKVAAASKAAIWQNGNRWYGSQADEDVILRTPVGSHLEALGGKPAPVPPAKPTPPSKPATPAAGTSVHIVTQGETLSGIADAAKMSVGQLEALNPHAGHPAGNFDNIWPGDRLTVKGTPPAAGRAKPTRTVQPGETLSSIADDWNVSLAAVEKANPRAGHPAGNFDTIWPGDQIVHP